MLTSRVNPSGLAACRPTRIQQAAIANSWENSKYVFDKAVEGKFIDCMDQNHEIFAHYTTDPALADAIVDVLRKQVYDQIRADPVAYHPSEKIWRPAATS